jgi:predicted nucleotidyltransferase component of viral defense system
MNDAIRQMLEKYERSSVDDHVNALREVFQEIALCGLWRGKFFERAAFYGGSCLRILHGLDRFSEDIDFSLLARDESFDLEPYCTFVENELRSWGFAVTVQKQRKTADSVVESAFLKATTVEQLVVIEAGGNMAATIPHSSQLKIKIEVDTDPPPNFTTETRFLLQPIPFSVRTYDLPCLFAGKMHAVLCRGWKKRLKGRDWYDFVWYVRRGTELDLRHLEQRMRQTGHYTAATALDPETVRELLEHKIEDLDVALARADIQRFLARPESTEVWSTEFFLSVAAGLSFR